MSIDDPLVLGPVAAFIFAVFVTEIVVSGKAYRREVEENKRLRTLTEKVVPLAENMVITARDLVSATRDSIAAQATVTDVLEDVLELYQSGEAPRPRRRRNS
ncbi:hypothetical protein PV336_16500 [Streptomyces sp. MI02-2A]|uniref:hypothetical protein n=1 Tax=Streptomyces sp. MI02-2A TaxID=3028688 RepID=UPI0029AAF92C|nr:hypothetical protein [Streptomyces sp. MI02-2A]MDX3260819.1 hypothetical protein [Streptomyces sp. MI02-2A]